MKNFVPRRRQSTDMVEGGQDSFLDIISNIVGILIILVMIAGAGVGSAGHRKASNPVQESTSNPVPELPCALAEESESFASRYDEEKEFVRLSGEFTQLQDEVVSLRSETGKLDSQRSIVQRQAEMTEAEHENLLMELTRVQGALDAQNRTRTEEEQKQMAAKQELAEIRRSQESLAQEKETLMSTAMGPVREIRNVPTPLTRKVEGHEGYFRLKGNKISHVPMNVFVERIRGSFRSFHDLKATKIENTIGPIEDYSFHFEATVRQVRDGERISMSLFFEYGECIPLREDIGEDLQAALSKDSQFQRKLSLYLGDSSTITMFVYPDSFSLLRDIKKFLIDHGYTIALRPMPEDQLITISPYGSESHVY